MKIFHNISKPFILLILVGLCQYMLLPEENKNTKPLSEAKFLFGLLMPVNKYQDPAGLDNGAVKQYELDLSIDMRVAPKLYLGLGVNYWSISWDFDGAGLESHYHPNQFFPEAGELMRKYSLEANIFPFDLNCSYILYQSRLFNVVTSAGLSFVFGQIKIMDNMYKTPEIDPENPDEIFYEYNSNSQSKGNFLNLAPQIGIRTDFKISSSFIVTFQLRYRHLSVGEITANTTYLERKLKNFEVLEDNSGEKDGQKLWLVTSKNPDNETVKNLLFSDTKPTGFSTTQMLEFEPSKWAIIIGLKFALE